MHLQLHLKLRTKGRNAQVRKVGSIPYFSVACANVFRFQPKFLYIIIQVYGTKVAKLLMLSFLFMIIFIKHYTLLSSYSYTYYEVYDLYSAPVLNKCCTALHWLHWLQQMCSVSCQHFYAWSHKYMEYTVTSVVIMILVHLPPFPYERTIHAVDMK